ncbi:MAG: selenocysteine-specific translation elongation factor [bacterium]
MSELEKKHIVIGTAGHIDHGKSALIKSLTGTDPDRLKEEKERGMTTDLGFAFYGDDITIIDVPGHEKFVRHMLAGASTIDFVIFVIAADDGIMPQTIEHLEILKLLQIKQGIIVITKIDLVDETHLNIVIDDIHNLTRDSFLQDAPIIPVSNVTGEGLDKLKTIINGLSHKIETKKDKGIFYMPIDRCFTMKGFGTVIAGTVLSGKIRIGDTVELLPIKKY